MLVSKLCLFSTENETKFVSERYLKSKKTVKIFKVNFEIPVANKFYCLFLSVIQLWYVLFLKIRFWLLIESDKW